MQNSGVQLDCNQLRLLKDRSACVDLQSLYVNLASAGGDSKGACMLCDLMVTVVVRCGFVAAMIFSKQVQVF
jgi:hypothetical protein